MTSSASSSKSPIGTTLRRVLPTATAIALVPILTMLGLWQLDRGRQRLETYERIAQLAGSPAIEVPRVVVGAATLADSPIVTAGVYDTEHQFLLDNQVRQGQPGYHVLTPLRIQGGGPGILVNRGWVPWNADRWQLPDIATPEGVVRVEGRAYEPPRRYFTLQHSDAQEGADHAVRQHLDMEQIAAALPYPLQPVVVLLAPHSPAGGFVREWPPADLRGVARHRAYAVQWFAMAAVVVIIWTALTWKSRKTA